MLLPSRPATATATAASSRRIDSRSSSVSTSHLLRRVSAAAPRSYSSLTMDFKVANPLKKEYKVDEEGERDRVRCCG
uniref:Uncharacterized protein n=1 Tax=Setaria viridis TaxID=4556 RepID=A0A4U6UVM9_SETVI|nr:hypothetical protein SEVIR_5G451366v2 [Setaria viridis]